MPPYCPGISLAASAVLRATPGIVPLASLDPSAVVDAPGPVRAAASFVLVSAFGAALLVRYAPLVERAAEDATERPLRSLLYGAIAYGVVAAVVGYGLSQLARIGVADTVVGAVGVALAVAIFLAFVSLGFVVVGVWVTGLAGGRQPWVGVIVGASLSAVPWLVLPVVPGFAAWLAVASLGIGGRTRAWIHDSRSVDVDPEP